MSSQVFLRALFDSGHIRVPRPNQIELSDDVERANGFLSEFERLFRLDFPGDAPAFHPPAASWAATMFYRAAQCAIFRDIPESEMRDGLSLPCPSNGDEAARHYSVDITFRFLPDLATIAGHMLTGHPVLQIVSAWANLWPLSSVGMKGVVPGDVDVIAFHPGLLQLYVDRILAREDFARLIDPRIESAVKQSVGAYADLSPTLAKHLKHG